MHASSVSGLEARFWKVQKIYGCISGDIILFVSSKRRRLQGRNLAVILFFIPFTTYQKTSFTEEADRSFTNGFAGPKSFRDFPETGFWIHSRCLFHKSQKSVQLAQLHDTSVRLLHRSSKRQSQTRVLFRTPITQIIFFNQNDRQ